MTPTEKMSKAVLLWDCNINLDEFNFQKDLMPIDQMWSKILDFNQLAGGTNAQPFNTVQDYKNWLKHVDGYLVWLQTAQDKMKEGIKSEYVLPKSLIVKVIPQFEGMAAGKAEGHLYYDPAQIIPNSFIDLDRSHIEEAYCYVII